MESQDVEVVASGLPEENVQAFCELLDQMKGSMSAAKDIVKSLREKYVLHIPPVVYSPITKTLVPPFKAEYHI